MNKIMEEDTKNVIIEHDLYPDDIFRRLIAYLVEKKSQGTQIADLCNETGINKETARYRLLVLQGAGIVESKKPSRSERRWFIKATSADELPKIWSERANAAERG